MYVCTYDKTAYLHKLCMPMRLLLSDDKIHEDFILCCDEADLRGR